MTRAHPLPRLALVACLAGLALASTTAREALAQEPSEVVVPRLWDEAALEGWATPLVGLDGGPGFFTSEAYYAAPVDNLRTYPVYHPDFEPEGYRDALLARGPQPLHRQSGTRFKKRKPTLVPAGMAYRGHTCKPCREARP